MAFVYSAFLSLATFFASVAKDETPFAPVDAAFGHDSSVIRPQASLAEDQRGWNTLWAAHRGTTGAALPATAKFADDRPPVDFRKNFVVGIFGGTMSTGIEGYRIVETAVEGDIAYIRFRPIASAVPQAVPPVTQPYGFVILPRTKAKIHVQVPKNRNEWSTVAQFPPTLVEKKK